MCNKQPYEQYVLPGEKCLLPEKEFLATSNNDEQEADTTYQQIVDTFAYFGIKVIPGEIVRGPTITRYELYYPAQKTSISSLTKYCKDIALATQASDINLLLPVPGKNTIGVEIANRKRIFIPFHDLINSPDFSSSKFRIPIPLGKNIEGTPVIRDLAAMPHILTAGEVNSGVSVFIKSILSSLLLKFRPNELRLILIDTRFENLQPFSKLPHLIFPLITDTHQVAGILNRCISEMEYRYRCFAKIGVRDIESFNKQTALDTSPPMAQNETSYFPKITRQAFQEETSSKFPYIIFIVNELSDLVQEEKNLKPLIARLARSSRATGIHMILATRNPRQQILTHLIKDAFHSRVAFRVSNEKVSELILEQKGAEKLKGAGDMFYWEIGSYQPERIQGTFISDDEIQMLTNHCSLQMSHLQKITEERNELRKNVLSKEDEECYVKSLEVALVEGKISASLLQRRLSIGYGRAARMMDLLETRGIIAPADTSNGMRQVLQK